MRLRSRDFWLSLTVALCSCAEHAPPVETQRAAPTPSAMADASAVATVQLLIPLEAGVDSGIDAVATSQKQSVEPSEWLTAHGIVASQHGKLDDASSCEERVVGNEHEPALVCTVMEDVTRKSHKFTMDRKIGHRTVNVVRAQTMVKVLDVVVSIEALDKANPRIHDVMPNPDSLPYREWPRFDQGLIQSACANLGDWVWQKDHFVRGTRRPADK